MFTNDCIKNGSWVSVMDVPMSIKMHNVPMHNIKV